MIVTSHKMDQAMRLATEIYVGQSDEAMLPLDKERIPPFLGRRA